MRIRRGVLAITVAAVLAVAGIVEAVSFPNSLWIGTDNTIARDVLNTDRSGTILRSAASTEATGFAIDLAANTIYFGASTSVITPRNLDTLVAGAAFAPAGSFSEDMTFDGSRIWRVDINLHTVQRINPGTGLVDGGIAVLSQPLGVAWDGSGLWVSQFSTGLVNRYTTGGVVTASFVAAGVATGGLAYDTTDGTLWIGTFDRVYHYTTSSTQLGFFDLTAIGRFVDGLEFQGQAVQVPAPWPGALILLAPAVAITLASLAKRHRTLRGRPAPLLTVAGAGDAAGGGGRRRRAAASSPRPGQKP